MTDDSEIANAFGEYYQKNSSLEFRQEDKKHPKKTKS